MLRRLDRQLRFYLSALVFGWFSAVTPVLAQDQVWFSAGQPTPLAWQAIDILEHADQDGLRPQDYQAQQLAQVLHAIEHAGSSTDAALLTQTDQRLTASIEKYLKELATGRVSPKVVHQNFDDAPSREYDAAAALQEALKNQDLAATVEQARPNFPLYPLLKNWLAHYRTLVGHPAWDTPLSLASGKKLESGQRDPQLGLLRTRLVLLGDDESSSTPLALSDDVYDSSLVQAVKAFQLRHGLTDDGIIGAQTLQALNVTPAERVHQIELSMERIRWTPLQHGQRILVVNLPGYMLYGYEVAPDGQIHMQLEMRVVTGKALNHRTPLMDETMKYIEFSPYWNIPQSIARSETIPALRRDPNYLARQQLEFVDKSGQVSRDVTPAHLEAVLKGQMRIRQRPGPHNALGGVKFAFPNNQNIFMHHTPATQLFSRSRRDFSHGCIRVEDPLALARFVLANEPEWTDTKIEQAMHLGKANFTRLREPVPVVIGYSTVMARNNGKIYFYQDVYGHDRTLEKSLFKQ